MDFAPFFTPPMQAPAYNQFIDLPPQSFPISGMEDESTNGPTNNADTHHQQQPYFPHHSQYDAFRFNHHRGSVASSGFHLDHSPAPTDPSSPPPQLGTKPPSHSAMPGDAAQSGFGADGIDGEGPAKSRSRENSEEKETSLTPAQSRRKLQNRAAQRAFRERKERHVRDLEAKLSELQSASQSLQSDNDRLKLALHRATTENKLLRATSAQNASGLPDSPTEMDEDIESTFPHMAPEPGSKSTGGQRAPSIGRLLNAAAAWDAIQKHPLVSSGKVDISDVWDKLQSKTRCSGTGPAWDERDINRAIENGRRGGGDELI